MNERFTDNGFSYMIRETPMNWDMTNTRRRITKNGTEVDALARKYKPAYLWGVPGARAWVKRQMRRRERREGKAEAREAGDG